MRLAYVNMHDYVDMHAYKFCRNQNLVSNDIKKKVFNSDIITKL